MSGKETEKKNPGIMPKMVPGLSLAHAQLTDMTDMTDMTDDCAKSNAMARDAMVRCYGNYYAFKSFNKNPCLVCYPPYCFCNFPFPRMGCSLVGGKGKSCRREILCYGIKGWIRQPVDENRGSIISIRVLIFARSWTSWRDASATVLCQKTVQLSRQRDAESAKWVMTSHF